jgi:hypothetical protein
MDSSKWHFTDYPRSGEQVLAKMTDGDLAIIEWDADKCVWYDLGRDYEWFVSGVACWAYVENVPETTKQMPLMVYSTTKAGPHGHFDYRSYERREGCSE